MIYAAKVGDCLSSCFQCQMVVASLDAYESWSIDDNLCRQTLIMCFNVMISCVPSMSYSIYWNASLFDFLRAITDE